MEEKMQQTVYPIDAIVYETRSDGTPSSIAIYGDGTKPYKDYLTLLGATYHDNLTINRNLTPGWLFNIPSGQSGNTRVNEIVAIALGMKNGTAPVVNSGNPIYPIDAIVYDTYADGSPSSIVLYGEGTKLYKDYLTRIGATYNNNVTINDKRSSGWLFTIPSGQSGITRINEIVPIVVNMKNGTTPASNPEQARYMKRSEDNDTLTISVPTTPRFQEPSIPPQLQSFTSTQFASLGTGNIIYVNVPIINKGDRVLITLTQNGSSFTSNVLDAARSGKTASTDVNDILLLENIQGGQAYTAKLINGEFQILGVPELHTINKSLS